MSKKYKVSFYETELVFLYRILRQRKTHFSRAENEILKVLKKKDFEKWKDIIEEDEKR